MEKLLEDVSFHAEDRRGDRLVIDRGYVSDQLDAVAKDVDLSKYVL
jgi:ATP-dependent HslUV protease ATP-binding subunit HslU